MTKYADVKAALGEFKGRYESPNKRDEILVYEPSLDGTEISLLFRFFKDGARIENFERMSLQTLEELCRVRRRFADWKAGA